MNQNSYLPFVAGIFEGHAVKLRSIVSDNVFRHSKPVDDRFSDGFFNIRGFDVGERLSFHQLGEIVVYDGQELVLSASSDGKSLQDVDSWYQLRCLCVREGRKCATLLAFCTNSLASCNIVGQ